MNKRCCILRAPLSGQVDGQFQAVDDQVLGFVGEKSGAAQAQRIHAFHMQADNMGAQRPHGLRETGIFDQLRRQICRQLLGAVGRFGRGLIGR